MVYPVASTNFQLIGGTNYDGTDLNNTVTLNVDTAATHHSYQF